MSLASFAANNRSVYLIDLIAMQSENPSRVIYYTQATSRYHCLVISANASSQSRRSSGTKALIIISSWEPVWRVSTADDGVANAFRLPACLVADQPVKTYKYGRANWWICIFSFESSLAWGSFDVISTSRHGLSIVAFFGHLLRAQLDFFKSYSRAFQLFLQNTFIDIPSLSYTNFSWCRWCMKILALEGTGQLISGPLNSLPPIYALDRRSCFVRTLKLRSFLHSDFCQENRCPNAHGTRGLS